MTSSTVLRGEALVGAAVAILFSVNTVFIILFSAVGITGNSAFSGSFLVACEAAILFLSLSPISLGAMDYLFAAFVLAAAISNALNGLTAGQKETAIFLVSIAGYPICRFVSATDRLRRAFGATSFCIAAIGAVAAAYAIFEQWPVSNGKPVVFGNDAAGAHFLMALSFFAITATSFTLTRTQCLLISAALFIMSVVFAAALVRFTFAALLVAIGLSFWFEAGKQRVYIAALAASVIFGAACGTLIRFDKIPILIGFMTEKTHHRDAPALPLPLTNAADATHDATQAHPLAPSCYMQVNMRNSIAERKALWFDSLYLIPRAGVFGLGLDGFLTHTCMKGFPPHNSIFQALIEFGWLGGTALSAMIAFALLRLGPTAKFAEADRFIVCLLAFAVLISLAHGRLSRDFVLFSVLGIAAARIDPKKVVFPLDLSSEICPAMR